MEKYRSSTGEISYRTQGIPQNPTILFLHGNSCNAKMFDSQFSTEFKDYYLVAPNFPGHSKSITEDKERTYSFQGLAEEIKELTIHLNLESILMYGASLGGHVAIELIPMLKEKVKGVMIAGTPPFKIPLNIAECFHDLPETGNIFKPHLNEEELQELANVWVYQNEVAKEYLKSWVQETDPDFRTVFGDSIIKSQGIGNQKEILEQTNCPVAIMTGEHEKMVKREYLKDLKPKHFYRNAIQIIANCAHFPNLENPKTFNYQLKEFTDYCFQP
ncbi:alpha/beta fold hydrolase [Marivirga sp.]|uniref:alpha/beta fold hydrolase n=1 Tax=Marivirga sp. TaxID=2018662 RepID=UPI003DA755E5